MRLSRRRVQELLHGMLGTVLEGCLMSDGYWAYRDYDDRLRCLTHLLRKACGLQDSLEPQAQAFGKTSRRCLETVTDVVYAAPEGPRRCRCANNTAERALCHWVIARRISYGTRNQLGSRAFTLLASVNETCRQHRHSPWSFIAETLPDNLQLAVTDSVGSFSGRLQTSET